MMAWEGQEPQRSAVVPWSGAVHSRFSAIEELKRFDDSMAVPGKSERRSLWVRSKASDADVTIMRERVTSKFSRRCVATTRAHYKLEPRVLPIGHVRVGDLRVPGSPLPTSHAPYRLTDLSLDEI